MARGFEGQHARRPSDIGHLVEEGFTPAEAVACVRANVEILKAYLPQAMQAELDQLMAGAPQVPTDGAAAWIDAASANAALTLLPPMADKPFEVVPRWECGES